MSDLLQGMVLAFCVVLLSMAGALLVGLYVDHRDRARHNLDQAEAAKRHKEIKDALDHSDRLLTTAITQYRRHDGEISDLREVALDHAELLDTLQPDRRARRPNPKPTPL